MDDLLSEGDTQKTPHVELEEGDYPPIINGLQKLGWNPEESKKIADRLMKANYNAYDLIAEQIAIAKNSNKKQKCIAKKAAIAENATIPTFMKEIAGTGSSEKTPSESGMESGSVSPPEASPSTSTINLAKKT